MLSGKVFLMSAAFWYLAQSPSSKDCQEYLVRTRKVTYRQPIRLRNLKKKILTTWQHYQASYYLKHVEKNIKFDDRLTFDDVIDHRGIDIVHQIDTADDYGAFQYVACFCWI